MTENKETVCNQGELALTVSAREFPIWKTVKLGHKSAEIYRNAMKKRVGNGANLILGNAEFTCATEKVNIDLVRVSVAELGFKEGAEYGKVCARALELGLELCPAEVGPALRLAYKDQPLDESLIVAMEVIGLSGGLNMFLLEHQKDDSWLIGAFGHPRLSRDSGSLFVFRAPRTVVP